MLTQKRIQELANRKNVKTNAVFNFLISISANPNEWAAYMNMEIDAKLYKWNAATCGAIRKGISEHFKK